MLFINRLGNKIFSNIFYIDKKNQDVSIVDGKCLYECVNCKAYTTVDTREAAFPKTTMYFLAFQP